VRFSIPGAILAKLRTVREDRRIVDDIVEREDAFLLDGGLGPGAYLTADGRILLDFRWDEGPVREATDDEATSYIVVGAKKSGLAELLDLLPPRPPRASTCARCDGQRWIAFGTVVGTNDPGQVVCWDCSGWAPCR
jgi:hypothetical protein